MKSGEGKTLSRRLARIVQSFRGRRIAVLGDWMLDRYVWGTASRLSPEAAVPVVDFVEQSETLGGAGNVARNLAVAGAHVEAFGVIADDDAGRAIRGAMKNLKLPAKGLLPSKARPTTLKTRIIARHQQVVRVDREVRTALDGALEERLIRSVIAALKGVDGLVLSDYDKGVVSDNVADRVLHACQRLGVPAFVKPKWSRLPTYSGATAIMCNRAEAGFLVTRNLDTDAEIDEAGRALLAHFGCAAVVITRGEQGMTVFEHDAPHAFHVMATSHERHYGQAGRDQNAGGRQVFDVTGAGDTALATFALAVAAGASIRDAAVLGNAAAGVVVGKLGTAAVSSAELLAAIRELPQLRHAARARS